MLVAHARTSIPSYCGPSGGAWFVSPSHLGCARPSDHPALLLLSHPCVDTAVAQQLQDISSHLGLGLDLVITLVARHEPLLLQPPHQLPARLELLSSALQLPPAATADLISTSAPQLLGTSLSKLQANLMQLHRVLGSRGLNPAEVLQARPDLLTQNPGTVEAKLEQLPGALGMSRQRVRQLISQCPELLRRSVATVSHRWAPGLGLC
jgi:hypothetical protein